MWTSRRKTSNFMIILIIIGLVVGGNGASRMRRILGGVQANPHEFPFHVVLDSSVGTLMRICGGAIITDRHVLTAAHCLKNVNLIIVRYGLISLNDPNAKSVHVEKVIIHPNFIQDRPNLGLVHRNDIGIAVLKEVLIFNAIISKIPLTSTKLDKDKQAIMAGWGELGEDVPSNTLHKITVSILKLRRLAIEPKEFCAKNLTGDFCSGDSGSPLITTGNNPVLIGIAVRSNCVAGDPNTYTNVYEYLSWIYSKIPSLATSNPKLCAGCSIL